MRKLILRCFQSPGDVVMLTAAVRDLHRAYPGEFLTDVRTSADALWAGNPNVTQLSETDADTEVIEMHYPLVHESNQRPYHFIHGFPQFLESRLSAQIPVTDFRGDVYLNDEEREAPPSLGVDLPGSYWIIVAGGKYDFTAKWWSPAAYQAIVNHFLDRIHFVQCGEDGHWHPRLRHATDLVGKTTLRQFVSLMHHAEGVVCPVTFAMHLAAAVEQPNGKYARPCIVVAGGREPPHWEAYPSHQFLHTVGMLDCCRSGGCWKSRCQLVGDGDPKDRREVCEIPVQIAEDLRIPKCMDMIPPEAVIRSIESYLIGQAVSMPTTNEPTEQKGPERRAAPATTNRKGSHPDAAAQQDLLIRFRHGLGDAVQLTTVLLHLRELRPHWNVDVAALVGKPTAFRGLCRGCFVLDRDAIDEGRYGRVLDLEWHECATSFGDSPSTKAERCLREVFGLQPQADLCRYGIEIGEESRQAARTYFERDCGLAPDSDGRDRAVLIHYEGNTSGEKKNLPHPVAAELCETVIRCGALPVIFDWDGRSPLPDGKRILNPHVDLDIWDGRGTGDAERIAALIELSALMVGVDSGPLHVAGATSTPTLAAWTGHHPVHYFGLAENVTHLVPSDHKSLLRGDRSLGAAYFARHYRHRIYTDLTNELCRAAEQHLAGADDSLMFTRSFWVRTNNAEQDLVVVSDIYERDSYAVDELDMPSPVVVDVGAHIGCFAARMHRRNPLAKIISVECCPENIPALRKNVEGFAEVVQAAVTYEQDIALKNAVFPNCETTGGSVVVPKGHVAELIEAGRLPDSASDSGIEQYWGDLRPVTTITLEELAERYNLETIDVLKLDCEGSEFSILEHCQMLDRIGTIVGEYHGRERFLALVKRRLPDWDLRILKDGELGTFWLKNPGRTGVTPAEAAIAARESAMRVTAAKKDAMPPLLVAALRNKPEVGYDLLCVEGGNVEVVTQHAAGWLRGFARCQGELWTIDSKGTLFRVESSGTLSQISQSTLAHEAHDLVVLGGKLATAGPTRSVIAQFDPQDGAWSAFRPWLSPPVPEDADGPDWWDRFHFNSLAHDGEAFVLSVFSLDPKPREQRWHQWDLRHGAVVRWGPHGFDEPLATDVYAPHSVRVRDGRVYWCESFRGRVCRCDGWTSPRLGGFARGLRFLDDQLIVGLSKSRVAPNPTLDRCGVALLHASDGRELDFTPLPEPYFEIYDLLPLHAGELENAS